MTSTSNSEQFELIFEGPEDGSSDTLRKLKGVFIGSLEFSIEDTQKALQSYPSTLKVAEREEDLTPLFYALRDAGARVLLVRPEGSEDRSELSFSDEEDDDGFEFDLEELLSDDPPAKSKEEPKEASVYELEEVDLDDPLIAGMQLLEEEPTSESTAEEISIALESLDHDESPESEDIEMPALEPEVELKEASVPELSLDPVEEELDLSLSLEPVLPDPIDELPASHLSVETEKPVVSPLKDDPESDFDLSIDLSDTPATLDLVDELVTESPEQGDEEEDFGADLTPAPEGAVDAADDLTLAPLVEETVKAVAPEAPALQQEKDDNALSLSPVIEAESLDLGSAPEEPTAAVDLAAVEELQPTAAAPERSKTLEAPDQSLSLSFDDESVDTEERPAAAPPKHAAHASGLSLGAGDLAEPEAEIAVTAPEVHEKPSTVEGVAAAPAVEADAPATQKVPAAALEKTEDAEAKSAPSVKPIGKVARQDVQAEADIDIDAEDEDYSEEIRAAAEQWNKKKKKDGLPLDVIGACLVGIVLLAVYNLYFVESEEPPGAVLDAEVVQAALQAAPKKSPEKKKEKVEKKILLTPLVNSSGSIDLEYANTEWTLGMRDGVPAAASFVLTTPEPPEATPEMIVRDQAPEPWMTKIEIAGVELTKTENQRYHGKGDAKMYVSYRDERTRVIGNVEVFIDKVTDSLYNVELSVLYGDVVKPDFVGAVTVRPENSENKQMGLSLLAMLQANAKTVPAEVEKDPVKSEDSEPKEDSREAGE